ncbi:MAG: hypothetical protein IT371_08590 [Deltaproteobacteria bacterium]|nr:hypothetical protein [Deltaproteobacteria bacterium]
MTNASHLPIYLLAEPLVHDRRVLEVGARDERGTVLLARGRPRSLTTWEPGGGEALRGAERLRADGPPLPLPAGSVDVVIAPDLFERWPALRERWMDELERLLAPAGILLVVAPNPERRGSEPVGPDALSYWELVELVRGRFPEVATLGQAAFVGVTVSYLDPPLAAQRLSVRDELSGEPEEAGHFAVLASRLPLPELTRYALVALPAESVVAPDPPDGSSVSDEDERAREREQVTRLRAELKQHEAELAGLAGRAARLHRLEEELTEARGVARAAQVHESQVAREQGRLKGQVELALAQHAALEQALAEARRVGMDAGRRAQEAESAATELALERDRTRRQLDELLRSQLELGEELEHLRRERREVGDSADEARRTADEAGRQAERLSQELRRVVEEAGALRDRFSALLVERDRLRETAMAEEERCERAEAARLAMQEERGALVERVAHLSAELAEVRDRRERLQAEFTSRVEIASQREEELRHLRARIEELGRELDAARGQSADLHARVGQWTERGKLLSEVAQERDRLRGELTKRLTELREAEARAIEAVADQRTLGLRAEVAEQQLQSARGELGARVERETQVAGRAMELEAAVGQLRGQLRAREEELGRLKQQTDELFARGAVAADLQGELRARGEQIDALDRELSGARQRCEELTAQLRAQAEEAERFRRAEATARDELAVEREARAAVEGSAQGAAAENARSREELNAARAASAEREAQLGALEVRLLEADAELKQVRGRHAELERELERRQRTEEHLRAQLDVGRTQLEALAGEVAAARAALVQRDELVSELQGDGQQRSSALVELQASLGEARQEIVDLQRGHEQQIASLRRDLEGLETRSAEAARRRELEIEVRSAELEVALRQLEALEGQIWLTSDEASRNAAQVAAVVAEMQNERVLHATVRAELEALGQEQARGQELAAAALRESELRRHEAELARDRALERAHRAEARAQDAEREARQLRESLEVVAVEVPDEEETERTDVDGLPRGLAGAPETAEEPPLDGLTPWEEVLRAVEPRSRPAPSRELARLSAPVTTPSPLPAVLGGHVTATGLRVVAAPHPAAEGAASPAASEAPRTTEVDADDHVGLDDPTVERPAPGDRNPSSELVLRPVIGESPTDAEPDPGEFGEPLVAEEHREVTRRMSEETARVVAEAVRPAAEGEEGEDLDLDRVARLVRALVDDESQG